MNVKHTALCGGFAHHYNTRRYPCNNKKTQQQNKQTNPKPKPASWKLKTYLKTPLNLMLFYWFLLVKIMASA